MSDETQPPAEPRSRRKNVLSVSATDQFLALCALLEQDPEEEAQRLLAGHAAAKAQELRSKVHGSLFLTVPPMSQEDLEKLNAKSMMGVKRIGGGE